MPNMQNADSATSSSEHGASGGSPPLTNSQSQLSTPDRRDDERLYVPQNDGWQAAVKPNSIKEYCYYRDPGDEHFHLLMTGELYLQKGSEKVCLNCARRMGIVTDNRLHWQQRAQTKPKPRY